MSDAVPVGLEIRVGADFVGCLPAVETQVLTVMVIEGVVLPALDFGLHEMLADLGVPDRVRAWIGEARREQNIADGGPAGAGDSFLQLVADGTAVAGGRPSSWTRRSSK